MARDVKGTNYENMPGKIAMKADVPCDPLWEGHHPEIDSRDYAGWLSDRGEKYTKLTTKLQDEYSRNDGEHTS